ncbi:helicase domain protein [Nitzschia inconspicua]|uniref:Helicase domain protein n=1 Tax=Nitzschia inconspicua TaxID=303405 RepID=A0A9K3KZ83_9STRA|nr:helicase domain protein [Nitzschia inconspicua]
MAPSRSHVLNPMSSGKTPSGKSQAEEDTEAEGMQFEANPLYQHGKGPSGDTASQNRRSTHLEDFNPFDPFQHGESMNYHDNLGNTRRLDPSMFQHQYQHARQQRDDTFDPSYYPGEPGMHPSGMLSLDQFPPYDFDQHHGSGISRSQSFDLGLFPEHGGHTQSTDSPMPYPTHPDVNDVSVRPANIFDRAHMYPLNTQHSHPIHHMHEELAGVDPMRFQGKTTQGHARRAFPTQDRNPNPPPSHARTRQNPEIPPSDVATLPESNSFYSQSEIEIQALGHPSSRRTRRDTNAPPAASLPHRGSAQGVKSAPKKGHATRSKIPRRSVRSNQGAPMEAYLPAQIDVPTSPTAEELENARTPRKREALITWYRRLSELVQFKLVNGHTNVPQQYDTNHSLGIWVNKQRMEKKAMDAGEKSSMTPEKVRLLEKAGFIWAKRKGQAAWEERFRELQHFQAQNGHCDVPTKNKKNRALGRWVSTQRSNYKKYKKGVGTLRPKTDEEEMERRIRCLEGIGFKWSLLPGSYSNEEEEEEEETDSNDEDEGSAVNQSQSIRRSQRNKGKGDGVDYLNPSFDEI